MKKSSLIYMVLIFLYSCVKDDVPPSITALNLMTSDTIRNVYSIKVEATDNEKINKVEIFINDSLVTEGRSIPFLFDWNTLKFDDGKYSVRLVVTDKQGNKTESLTEVLVNNNLLTVKAGSLYYFPHYIVVSDEEGNVLDTAVLKRNTITVLKPQVPFQGKSINFIWLRKGQGVSTMSGYVHIKRGSEFKLSFPEAETFKYVKLHFINDIPSFSKIVISTDLHFHEFGTIADTVLIPQPFPYTSGHKLLIQVFKNEGRYYRLYDIDGKQDVTIKLSTLTSLQEHKTISFPENGEAGYTIRGNENDNELKPGYYISNASTNNAGHTLDLWYPAEYFIMYNTHLGFIRYDIGNKSFTDCYNGNIPNTYTSPDADINLMNSAAGDFRATLTGTLDFYTVDFRNEDRSIQFSVTSPVSCPSWKFPDPGSVFNESSFSLSRYHPDLITINEFQSLDLRDKYYDLSIDFQKLYFNDPHYKQVFINYH